MSGFSMAKWDPNSTKHGWFSQKAYEAFGGSWYATPNGGEVLITCVADNEDYDKEYLWEDKRHVGIVTTWLRKAGYGTYGCGYIASAGIYRPADRVAFQPPKLPSVGWVSPWTWAHRTDGKAG